MSFFRRGLNPSQSQPRAASTADFGAIRRLLSTSQNRFLGMGTDDLAALLAGAPAMVLEGQREIWAVAVAGWQIEHTCWLRALVLADGLPVGAGLDVLLPPFCSLLRSRAIQHLFYSGDSAADAWMQPSLQMRGFVRDTEVVVYEKQDDYRPAFGNQQVRLRRAQPVDLAAISALDAASFSAEWVKDEGVLGPAIADIPYFMVAELGGALAGYAFASSHFQGRLVHLVRIAVHPRYQGQAIGVRLLAEVVGFAHSSGATSLTLNTQINNLRAQRLYEWFGFERTGERQTILRCDL